ncbi:MAG: DUF1569 domain-containing protein [Bacteroidota bacterium]
MRSLHDTAVLNEFTTRINALKPDAPRQWGKMTVAQMMAHCSAALENNMATGNQKQGLIGWLIGGMIKKKVVSDQPFKQGSPTAPAFIIKDERDFKKEQQRLVSLVTRLSTGGPTPDGVHMFFGKMSSDEWNTLNYKHLDHHLRQFGV